MTFKVLAASVILNRNPFNLYKEISEIIIDCDGDSDGYFNPVYAEPSSMGLREILSHFRFNPGANFAKKFIDF